MHVWCVVGHHDWGLSLVVSARSLSSIQCVPSMHLRRPIMGSAAITIRVCNTVEHIAGYGTPPPPPPPPPPPAMATCPVFQLFAVECWRAHRPSVHRCSGFVRAATVFIIYCGFILYVLAFFQLFLFSRSNLYIGLWWMAYSRTRMWWVLFVHASSSYNWPNAHLMGSEKNTCTSEERYTAEVA